jgi:hypothetical protein
LPSTILISLEARAKFTFQISHFSRASSEAKIELLALSAPAKMALEHLAIDSSRAEQLSFQNDFVLILNLLVIESWHRAHRREREKDELSVWRDENYISCFNIAVKLKNSLVLTP